MNVYIVVCSIDLVGQCQIAGVQFHNLLSGTGDCSSELISHRFRKASRSARFDELVHMHTDLLTAHCRENERNVCKPTRSGLLQKTLALPLRFVQTSILNSDLPEDTITGWLAFKSWILNQDSI